MLFYVVVWYYQYKEQPDNISRNKANDVFHYLFFAGVLEEFTSWSNTFHKKSHKKNSILWASFGDNFQNTQKTAKNTQFLGAQIKEMFTQNISNTHNTTNN